ncbi:MAG: hypothetical protein N3A64_03360 [Desulfobacterota bacterium]|nr:hypothetical protein [Thermodesulfobacteriota bacterium]
MIKSGISHLLTFLVSLVLGHAVLLLLRSYAPEVYGFFLRFGEAIALIFKISYEKKFMAAFVIASILSFLGGMIFYKLFNLRR